MRRHPSKQSWQKPRKDARHVGLVGVVLNVLMETPIHKAEIPVTMETANALLVCTLDAHQCAFRLDIVQRVVRAAALTPLPKAPKSVLGVVNVAGQLVPVFNLRQRFGLPARELEPTDCFVIVRAVRFSLIFVVDTVVEVREHESEKKMPLKHLLPKASVSAGVECFGSGLIVINTVNSFLLAEEERLLTKTLPGIQEVR